MVYFTDIQPTDHFLEEHEEDVPWDKVVEIIFTTKNPRKEINLKLKKMVITYYLK